MWIEGDTQTPRQRLGSIGYAYMASGLAPGAEVIGTVATGTSAAIKATNTATSSYCFGVYGVSASSYGRGVGGFATASSGYAIGGRFESAATNGRGVNGWATDTTGVTHGVYGQSDSPSGYGVYYSGGLGGSGSKSFIVKTSQGPTALYCQESPENWFEDFGEGQLVNGNAHIELDPLFLETVTIDEANPMKVFVQLHDRSCNGVAVEKGLTGFDVVELHDGTSSGSFDYRIVAKRKDFEQKRLDYCKAAETDSYLYPELREKERQELEEEKARIEEERHRMDEERAHSAEMLHATREFGFSRR